MKPCREGYVCLRQGCWKWARAREARTMRPFGAHASACAQARAWAHIHGRIKILFLFIFFLICVSQCVSQSVSLSVSLMASNRLFAVGLRVSLVVSLCVPLDVSRFRADRLEAGSRQVGSRYKIGAKSEGLARSQAERADRGRARSVPPFPRLMPGARFWGVQFP